MGSLFRFLQYGLAISSVTDKIRQGWYWICLSLDGIVYSFINFFFKLFLVLAGTNIFTEDTMVDFMRRIYQLIGVIMLFMLSYALLKKVVSPESKDKESPSKLVFNVVKAIVLLAIVPSIFTYAFKIQDAILKQNTIGKLIIGNNSVTVDGKNKTPDEIINDGGIMMAQGVFEAFFFPSDGDENTDVAGNQTYKELSNDVANTGDFQIYKVAVEAVDDGKITYYWGIALLAGAVVLYMLITYCISLGFRIIKLAFYEVMAPVCIIASIIPSQKEMLSRWIKTTLQVFLETFIRIAILYFVIYLLTILKRAMASGDIFANTDGMLKGLCWVAIILGLVTFMKSAPDLISKLTGIDSSNMSLGLKDQLAKGGFFTAGAAAGALVGGGIRRAVGGIANADAHRRSEKAKMDRINKDPNSTEEQKKAARKAYKRRVGSSVASGLWAVTGGLAGGAASGLLHSGANEAKDFKSMKEARDKGIKYSVEKGAEHSGYIQRHGGLKNAAIAKITDFKDKMLSTYAGINDPNIIRATMEQEDEIKNANDELSSKAESAVRTGMAKHMKTSLGLEYVDNGLEEVYADYFKKLSVTAREALKTVLTDDKYNNLRMRMGIEIDNDEVARSGLIRPKMKTADDLRKFEAFTQQLKLTQDDNAINVEEAFNTAIKSYAKGLSNIGLLGEDKSAKTHALLEALRSGQMHNMDANSKENQLIRTEIISEKAAFEKAKQDVASGVNPDALKKFLEAVDQKKDGAQKVSLSIGELETAGTRLRGAITRSLGDVAVSEAGVKYTDVEKKTDIKLTGDIGKKFSDLFDNIDISRSNLRTKLAKLNEAEKAKGEDKK